MAAIATVGVINAGVVDAVTRDAAALLGGDIRLETNNLPIAEDELAVLIPPAARRSDAVRTNAMASGAEGRRVVVSLKAVDDAYPLYGEVELEPALEHPDGAGRAAVPWSSRACWRVWASRLATRSKSARRRSPSAPPWSGSRIGSAASSASGRGS